MNWRNGGDGDIQTAKYANSPRKETGKTAKDRQSRKDVYREIRQIREIGGNGTSKEVRKNRVNPLEERRRFTAKYPIRKKLGRTDVAAWDLINVVFPFSVFAMYPEKFCFSDNILADLFL
jgi:hypothetical protein